jgi:hypothetical protein
VRIFALQRSEGARALLVIKNNTRDDSLFHFLHVCIFIHKTRQTEWEKTCDMLINCPCPFAAESSLFALLEPSSRPRCLLRERERKGEREEERERARN